MTRPSFDSPGSAPSEAVGAKKPTAWVFYHYLYPDNVVSSIHMTQLCEGLQSRGWAVTGLSGNRGCRDEQASYPSDDEHHGVWYRRYWRPAWTQSSTRGRLLNAAWMIVAWSLAARSYDPPDAIVIGTDPILSVTAAIFWKLWCPHTRVLHWCFDLYPEAAFADGMLSPSGRPARLLRSLMKRAYAACDAIVDIGPCMRRRLAAYVSPARTNTIVPWALEEPADVLPVARAERQEIAGHAALAMLYSGNFGRAHLYEDFLALATILQGENAALAFSIRGNREAELRAAVRELPARSSCPVRMVAFAPAECLLDRLAAPDVHMLSLAPGFSGLVVPSKFFGALAIGRPILFSGSADSSIAEWIEQYRLGWVLTPYNVASIARELLDYVADPALVAAMQQRCFDTYQRRFSRKAGIDSMDQLLQELLAEEAA